MRKLPDLILEVIGWCRIVASPMLASIFLAAVVYYSSPSTFRLYLAIFICIAGLVCGIVWANRVWKKHGTMYFLSQVSATPDLDQKQDDYDKQSNK
jgi:hypothetical protein